MQNQEITVQQAADYVERYMKSEEHIQRLVDAQRKNENDDGSAIYGQIVEALSERITPQKTSSRK